jgi:hypothetical protein
MPSAMESMALLLHPWRQRRKRGLTGRTLIAIPLSLILWTLGAGYYRLKGES